MIAADPGTRFNARSSKGETARSPQKKYTTLSDAEIAALPVRELAAPDCHLFYWETGPRLVIGAHIPIMRAWGFEPTAIAFTWIKTKARDQGEIFLTAPHSFHVGMGFTTRKNAEFCVLGRRGSPQRMRKDVRELIIAPRREHSRKPDEFYDRVRAYAAGPYLELFSRQVRPAWDSWGDEVGKFGGAT